MNFRGLLSLFSVLLMAYSSNAQVSELSIIGGANLSSFRGNDFLTQYHQAAVYSVGGIQYRYLFNKHLSAHVGILAERKGSKVESKLFDAQGTDLGKVYSCNQHDYLVIPFLARFSFGQKIQYYVQTGAYYAYLLSAKVKTTGDNVPSTTSNSNSLFEKSDFGITLGIGASIPLSAKFALCGEIRHNYGLVNTSAVPVYNSGSIKTNSTNLTLGLSYYLR